MNRRGDALGGRRLRSVVATAAAALVASLTSASVPSSVRWAGQQTVTLSGSGFDATVTAYADGFPLVTTYVSASSATAILPRTYLWEVATVAITAKNASTAASAAQNITVTNRTDLYAGYDGANVALNGADVQVMTCFEGSLGSAGNLAQITGASQPTLDASTLGGQPSVKGDGVNDFLQMSASSASLADLTVICVFRPTSLAAQQAIFGFDSTQARLGFNATSGTMISSDGTFLLTTANGVTVGASNVVVLKRTGTTGNLSLNRGTAATGTFNPVISRFIALNRGSLGALYFSGFLGKAIVFSSSLSAAVTTEVLDYLSAKYGTP